MIRFVIDASGKTSVLAPRSVTVLIVAITSLAPLTLSADESHGEHAAEQQKMLLIGAPDIVFTKTELERLNIDEAWLLTLVRDMSQTRYVRQRAIGALAILGSTQARVEIERIATNDTDLEVRAQAIRSLAWTYGPRDPEGVRELLTRLRRDLDPATRAARIIDAELVRLAPASGVPAR